MKAPRNAPRCGGTTAFTNDDAVDDLWQGGSGTALPGGGRLPQLYTRGTRLDGGAQRRRDAAPKPKTARLAAAWNGGTKLMADDGGGAKPMKIINEWSAKRSP